VSEETVPFDVVPDAQDGPEWTLVTSVPDGLIDVRQSSAPAHLVSPTEFEKRYLQGEVFD
jgi:hypothetical protein